ncbi:MAG: hypothetical protein F6K19_31460 [Cyanothece sp. SIO1E1]|nr:hypothetical protein [Cyanothece sp. SIO1E1]
MSQTLTGVDYLGCPYDIYGHYARGSSVNTSQRLFSLPDSDTSITILGDDYLYPKDAIGTPVILGEADEIISIHESTEEISTELAASIKFEGTNGLFKAEADAKYSAAYTSSSYFYHIDQVDYIHSYKLTLDLDYVLKHLDKDFEADLNDTVKDAQGNVALDEEGNVIYVMNAAELVAKYGTHFLYEAYFGGRRSYSQSFSKFRYESSSQAEAKFKSSYSTYEGSISGSSEIDESHSNHESNGEFWCIGGVPATLVDGFSAWAASVPGNFVLVGFTENSLKRISELVEDEIRKAEINTAIKNVLEGVAETSTYLLTTSANNFNWDKGSDNIDKEIEVDSGSKKGYAVVGFGGRIKDKKFDRIAVCYLNLATGIRDWEVFGNRTVYNETEYETLGEVPEGCVLTGIGLKGDDSNFRKMVLHYQELAPANPASKYLGSDLKSIAYRLQDEVEQRESSYDVEFDPGSSNNVMITGIGVGYRGKKERVQYLKLYRNTIEEEVVETEDAAETEDAVDAVADSVGSLV